MFEDSGVFGEMMTEIYEDVMNQIKEDLSILAPKYKKQIETNLLEALKEPLLLLTRRIEKLEKKCNQLEEQKEYSHEYSVQSVKYVKPFNSETKCGDDEKINMNLYDIRNKGYEFAGWVYYPNSKMGDFLYKVRTDGLENQLVTNYSVKGNFRINGNRLYFLDALYKERYIEL